MRGTPAQNSRIDRHDHSLLAVHRLRTVKEHRRRAHDRNIKRADHAARAAVEGDEAAVDAGRDTCGAVYGPAWRGRLRLRDGVIALCELELQHVARVGGDAVRREGQRRAADQHGDDLVWSL